MLNLEYLQQLLVIAIALSAITCALIQKTKGFFKTSKYLCLYSFIINISLFYYLTYILIFMPSGG